MSKEKTWQLSGLFFVNGEYNQKSRIIYTVRKIKLKRGLEKMFYRLSVIVLALLLVTACGGSSEPKHESTPREKAWTACTVFIEQQMDISTLKAQDYTAINVKTQPGDIYIVEVHYPSIGDTYQCEIAHLDNGDWKLEGLKVLR